MTLAEEFEGVSLVAPNDLVIDKTGGIYFTDSLRGRFRPTPAGRTTAMIFYIRPQDGKLAKVSEAVANPNGITLSPDEKVLFVANGETVAAFDVQPDGTLRNFRTFATLVGSTRNAEGVVQGGADSICVDEAGRLYVAGPSVGVQVFNQLGEHLGIIPTPLRSQAVAFAGRDKKTLYIVGSGAVYKIAMIAQGVQGRAK